MINEKQFRLIDKINKDLRVMCFDSKPENVGLAYMRIQENLRTLTTTITGVEIADILKTFCE